MEPQKQFSMLEAMTFNEKVIKKWEPSSEVWPFVYGDDALGIMTSLGSIYTTHFLRKQLKIRPFARMTCYLPTVGIPSIACFVFHSAVISSDILSRNACSLCTTTKACFAQALFGIAFPLALGSVTCFYVADRLLTYPVPPLRKAPKEVFLLFQKLVKKNARPFSVIFAINMIAASFITYKKQNVFFNLDLTPKKNPMNVYRPNIV